MHENPFAQGCKASFGRAAKLGTSIKKTVNAGRCLIKKERIRVQKRRPFAVVHEEKSRRRFFKEGHLDLTWLD